MKNIIFISLILVFLSACSEEAEPYEEMNKSVSSKNVQGYIDTH